MLCLRKDKSAVTIVKAVFVNWICHYGMPRSILNDRAKEFVEGVVKQAERLMCIQPRMTPVYCPRRNGLVEQRNGLVKKIVGVMKPLNVGLEISVAIAQMIVNQEEAISGYAPYDLLFGESPVRSLDHVLSDIRIEEPSYEDIKRKVQEQFEDYRRVIAERRGRNIDSKNANKSDIPDYKDQLVLWRKPSALKSDVLR